MTKFEKPFSRDWDYPDMVKEAGTKAFEDSGLTIQDIEQAAVGYCYGDSTYGQRSVYELGMTGIPIYNVNNNCSTGSTATSSPPAARANASRCAIPARGWWWKAAAPTGAST